MINLSTTTGVSTLDPEQCASVLASTTPSPQALVVELTFFKLDTGLDLTAHRSSLDSEVLKTATSVPVTSQGCFYSTAKPMPKSIGAHHHDAVIRCHGDVILL
jgi:hypothetical protein